MILIHTERQGKIRIVKLQSMKGDFMKKAIPGEISEKEDMKAEAVNKAPRSLIAIIAPSARSKWMHSRFFVNLVNLVGWSSPTKHLVHVAYFLVGDAHPTP